MRNITQNKKVQTPAQVPASKPVFPRTPQDEKIKVMIIHPINRLKEKMGMTPEQSLTITNEQMRRADEVNQDMAKFQPVEMESILNNMMLLWDGLQKIEVATQSSDAKRGEFLITLNKLEGLTLQFTSTLITDFTLSLKDFMYIARLDKKAHKVIIQAHLDVIILAHRHKIKDTEKAEAAKLKSMLQLAIRKNQ